MFGYTSLCTAYICLCITYTLNDIQLYEYKTYVRFTYVYISIYTNNILYMLYYIQVTRACPYVDFSWTAY